MRKALKLFISVLFLPSLLFASAVTKVQIKTPDSTVLEAVELMPLPSKPLVILLHGLDSHKEEWEPLMKTLQKEGWGYLAYDARRSGTPWSKWVDDQGAVLKFVEKSGVPREKVYLAGASVGANVSLKYSALTGVGQGIILLSPGLNYQGVITNDAIKQVKVPVLIIASPADSYAATSSLELKSLSPKANLWLDTKPGHGTQMFDEALLKRIMDWLKKREGKR